MREQAWEIFEPQYRARLEAIKEEAALASSRKQAEVAAAAAAGRVQTLLLEAGRQLPGRLDPATGEVARGELDDPQTDDLLADLADLVATMGGEVVVVPAEDMRTYTGLAAIYRY